MIDFFVDSVCNVVFWNICKGIFFVVGVVCEIGIIVIIEDVVFMFDKLV